MSKRKTNSNDGDLASSLPVFVKKPKLEDMETLPTGFGKQSVANEHGYAIDKTIKKKVSHRISFYRPNFVGRGEREIENHGPRSSRSYLRLWAR
jgi:hypothetical protein